MGEADAQIPGRKLGIICDGCREQAEGRMRSMPVKGSNKFFVFIRPPRGWYMTEIEYAPSPEDLRGGMMAVFVCPRCIEGQMPLGHDSAGEN